MTEKSSLETGPAKAPSYAPIDRTAIDKIKDDAAEKARKTSLPGETDGPADAYRHIVGIAELTRREGARKANAIGTFNEITTLFSDASQMDLHNNDIGRRIGKDATSSEEIERRAMAEIRAAVIEGGTGKNGTAVYLPEREWRDRDARKAGLVWPLPGFAKSSQVERDLASPPESWSDAVRERVMRDQIYWDTNHPRQAEAFEAVRRSFEHRPDKSEPRSGDTGTGGPVNVRSYKRDDGTKVDAHSRSAPALHGR
jgi:hypothetical protein